ncbi:MAG: threonine/serine dehydratase [Maricaulaceae bacterium]
MSATEELHPPAFEDIVAAAARLDGVARRTPLLRSDVLDAATGARVLIKAECLQRTGSFKIRGATNLIAKIPEAERARGVVAASSGNHAQGVAEAARLFGVLATIVMPTDAPAGKVEGVRERGAQIVFYDRASEDRVAIMTRLAREAGSHLAPPYDHPDVIAGQGTVGLELAAQAKEASEALDAVYCNVGGGGLISGVALALGHESPDTKIYAVEPVGFDNMRRSLIAGRRVENAAAAGSICDALLPLLPGELTFAIARDRLAGGVAVTDAEALAAVGFAFRRLKIVLEPGGAASLAAALFGKRDLRGKTVGVVVTGGNVDPAVFARAIGAPSA